MPNPTDFCNPCIFSERRGRRSLLWNCADIKSFQAGEHSSPLTVLQMISVVFADSRKGCPYDFVFQFVADDAHIVQKSYISLFAYGESVRRGRRTLRICREFVRFRRANTFRSCRVADFFCIKIKMRREQAPPHFEHINFKFLKAFPFRQPYSVYNIL